MHRDLIEWCSGWYDEAYDKTSPAADPEGPSSAGSFRVIRGGDSRRGQKISDRGSFSRKMLV
jgi:formylglycine-generating enzyme required for sulfatase activity